MKQVSLERRLLFESLDFIKSYLEVIHIAYNYFSNEICFVSPPKKIIEETGFVASNTEFFSTTKLQE